MSREKYNIELGNSKCIVSPFGWGEVCYRDFEAFVYGATLIKPSMDHLMTYPDWYKENETYIPIDWDFDGFKKVVCKDEYGDDDFLRIASNAQGMYLHFTRDANGKKDFASHIIEELEKKDFEEEM